MDPRQLIAELRLKGVQFTESGVRTSALDAAGATPGAIPDPLAKAVRTKLPKMTERQWQDRVIEYARSRGYKVAHFRKVRIQRKDGSTYWETPVAADGKGWLDLILANKERGKFFVVELKVKGGRVEPEQQEWADVLAACLIPVFFWRPADWDELVAVLG